MFDVSSMARYTPPHSPRRATGDTANPGAGVRFGRTQSKESVE